MTHQGYVSIPVPNARPDDRECHWSSRDAERGHTSLEFFSQQHTEEGCRCTETVRRTLLCVVLMLPMLFFSGALAGRGAQASTGTVTFHGRVIGQQAPFALGSLATVRAIVIVRSDTCIEVRVLSSGPPHQPILWLCAPSVHGANRLPEVGESILARVRITRIEAAIPFSDSFILLRAN